MNSFFKGFAGLVAVGFALAMFAGCGGDLAVEQCEEACEWNDDCDVDNEHPFCIDDCEFDDANGNGNDVSSECEQAQIDLHDCEMGLSCDEGNDWHDPLEEADYCQDEQDAVIDNC